MKKTKKLFLTVATMASVVTPLATIISCSNSSAGNPSILPKQRDFKLPDMTLNSMKDYFEKNKAKYPELTKQVVESISPQDIKQYLHGELDDDSKNKFFKALDKLLINFSFDKNGDPVAMEEMYRYIQNAGLNAYSLSPTGGARVPIRGNLENGQKVYERRDLGFNMQSGSGHPDIMHATPATIDGKIDNQLVDYNKIAKTGLTTGRILDRNYSQGNTFNSISGNSTSFSLFRQFTIGVDIKMEQVLKKVNGKWVIRRTAPEKYKKIWENASPAERDELIKKWEKSGGWVETRQDITELANGFLINVTTDESGEDSKWRTYSTADKNNADYKEVNRRLSEKVKKISYKLETDDLFYATVKDGDVVKSDVQVKMKDFYYGWVRSILASKGKRGYTSKDKDGNIVEHKGSGIIDKNGDYVIKPLTLDEQKVLDNQPTKILDNKNYYLFDLYKIDVAESLKKNKADADNDVNEFSVVYGDDRPAGISPATTLQVFTNASFLSPAPSEVIDERYRLGKSDPKTKAKFDGKTGYLFGLINYGLNSVSNDILNIEKSDYYSIAPYLYTQYDLNDNQGYIIKQNSYYSDKIWAKREDVIKVYKSIQRGAGDVAQYQTARKSNYISAKDHEYVLDKAVKDSKVYMNEIDEDGLYIFNKPSETDLKNIAILYSIFGAINGGNRYYNAKGRKLVFGYETVKEINENTDSISNFYSGTGREIRSIVKSSINWYTYIQTSFPNQDKEFYASYLQSTMFEASGINLGSPAEEAAKQDSITKPDFLVSYDDLKNVYWMNNFSLKDQFKSPTYNSAAKRLDEIATKYGATESDPAVIPLASWIFVGNSTPENVKLANKSVLEALNKMSAKVQFHFANEDLTWSEFVDGITTENNYVGYVGFGLDYNGVGSLFQQFSGEFGSLISIDMMRKILGANNE